MDECERLFEAAAHRCSVCRSHGPLVIDHDHETDIIRGVICKQCNIALGGARDNIATLRRLIAYLDDPPALRVLGRAVVKRRGAAPLPRGPRRSPR